MIKEDYVSFETARLLKEKGFDCNCDMYYTGTGSVEYTQLKFNHNELESRYSKPTLQLVLKWLRETHGIEVIVDVCKVGEDQRTMYAWTPVEVKEDRLEYPVSQTDGSVFGGLCNGYGQAMEKGIEYCLENLI